MYLKVTANYYDFVAHFKAILIFDLHPKAVQYNYWQLMHWFTCCSCSCFFFLFVRVACQKVSSSLSNNYTCLYWSCSNAIALCSPFEGSTFLFGGVKHVKLALTSNAENLATENFPNGKITVPNHAKATEDYEIYFLLNNQNEVISIARLFKECFSSHQAIIIIINKFSENTNRKL